MKAIILAGGIGSRLWPMSRATRPKQFYEVVSERPLIRDTYYRLRKAFAPEDIYFSISPAFFTLIRKEFPEVPETHIFVEPEKRDTGPAMGYVAALLEQDYPDEPIVFIPSDHFIQNEERFLQSLHVGADLIRRTGKMVDIGIVPTFPSTVLGYTRIGEPVAQENGIDVFQFAGHTEKPEYEIAKAYLEEGSYLWHANYYMWTPAKFMQAYEAYAPAMAEGLREIQKGAQENNAEVAVKSYRTLEKISFDYAITEHMNPADVLIIRGDFGWSDIGAWDTLYDRLAETEGGNVTKGRCVAIDTNGSLIYGPEEKLVTVVGMQNVVVVDTGDALLVCPREQAQQVKVLVEQLKEDGHESFL